MEDGLLVYEVYIITPSNQVFEVEVHAKTGNVIRIDQEDDFDFDWSNIHVEKIEKCLV